MCNKNTSNDEKYVYTPEEYEEARTLSAKQVGKTNSERWASYSKEEQSAITAKQQEGRNNKSEEEKILWFQSIGDALNKRTEEQWKETKIKKQTTWANRTSKQKEASRLKKQKTLLEHPEIEVERKRKEKITKSNWTEEQKAAYKKKKQDTWKNMSDKVKLEWERKRQQTRTERGIDTSGKNNAMSKPIKCIETNQEYECIKDAAKSAGMKDSTFRKYLKMGKPDINGNTWEYINNKEEH